jgi:hypothetical protein
MKQLIFVIAIAASASASAHDPADPRADDIVGDVMANGQVNASWGLHLIDVNLAMGNLVDIVREQGKAYLAVKKSSAR